MTANHLQVPNNEVPCLSPGGPASPGDLQYAAVMADICPSVRHCSFRNTGRQVLHVYLDITPCELDRVGSCIRLMLAAAFERYKQ